MRAIDAAVEKARVIHVREREVKGIDRRVRHAAGADQTVRQVRLALSCLGNGQLLAGDARAPAELRESLGEPGVVALDGNEQPAGGLDAPRRQPLQELVLLPALDRRLEVGRDVAGARVQQAVIAARRARAQVDLVDEDRADAAQREIAHDPGAGHPAADDQHFGVERRRAGRIGLLAGVCVHGVGIDGLARRGRRWWPALPERRPRRIGSPRGSRARPDGAGGVSRAAP